MHARAPKRPRKNAIPDSLRVLIVGGGGREHALAAALKKSPSVKALFCTHPSNPGIKSIAQPMGFEFDPGELYRVAQFCERESINLVVVGPEAYLAAGITDELSSEHCAVFGPTKAAAQLECDKAFAKDLMRSASIPTADARVFRDPAEAKAYIYSRETPQVVKASGLAAGKGVYVPASADEAAQAVSEIMEEGRFGEAGKTVLVEERLKGPEVSVFALVDGQTILTLDVCQDHKRLRDGGEGPNTGGMGAFCPSPLVDARLMASIEREILVPTVDALKREGIDYRGVLYAGLMLTPGGPKVLEFNARFGDPETQSLLHRTGGDWGRVLYAAAVGGLAELTEKDLRFTDNCACTVVLASGGYPDAPRTGHAIEGLEEAQGVSGAFVYHAGTVREEGEIRTAGGRVLGVTGTGPTIEAARTAAYEAVSHISFPGMQMRTDIGASAVASEA